MKEKTIRQQLRERFGLTDRAAHFAFLQATKAAEDRRTDGERYHAAGFKATGPSAASKASRMVRDGNFKDAVAFAREKSGTLAAEHAFELDGVEARQASLRRLTRRAEGSLADVLGDEIYLTPERWRGLPKEVRCLVSELDVVLKTGKDGKSAARIKIKTESSAEAERQLAKLGGWNEPVKFQDATPLEVTSARLRVAAEIDAELRKRKE